MKKEYQARSFNFLIIPLVALAVFLAVGSAIWGDYRDQIMENHKQQLLLTAQTLAENMELSLVDYQDSLQFLSEVAQENDDMEIYHKFLQTHDNFTYDLFWETEQGEIIKSVKKEEMEAQVLFSETAAGENVWQYSDAEGNLYLVFKKQLESGEKLCLAVDEGNYYQKLISNIHIGTNGYIVIKNSEGIIVMHPEKEQWGIHVIEGRKKMFPDLDYSSLENMIEEQCSGETGMSEYYSYWWSNPQLPRVKKISAYAPVILGQTFWTVSAVVDYDDFYVPIQSGFQYVSLLFIGGMVMFLIMFAYMGKLFWQQRKAGHEIESLKALNEKLEEIHKGQEMIAHQQRLQVMGTMTGGIAHEFNNFLTPIMGHAELLMMDLPQESEEYESAVEIYEASQKARDVVRQIASLSRRNVETVYKVLPVNRLLQRVMKMMESICPPNVRIEKEITVQDECILGNSTQINQVLLNICVNGFHAIGKKDGILRIHAGCAMREELESCPELESFHFWEDWKKYLCIVITDNGCGMEPEILRQIFEPFFTTKKAGEGTGLGLALAEQIVTSHKGYIYAKSEPKKGTAFHLIFPVIENGAETDLFVQEEGESLKIVVADDNAKVLKLLEKNFSKLKLNIATCRNKKELQELLELEQRDVLVIDESLEDANGIEFCMAMQGKYPDMIKLMMVDYFTEEIVDAKHKGIIDGYLSKPVSDTTILETILNCREERKIKL